MQDQSRSKLDSKLTSSLDDLIKTQRKTSKKNFTKAPKKTGKGKAPSGTSSTKKEPICITVHNERAQSVKNIKKSTNKPTLSQKIFQKGFDKATGGAQAKGRRQVILP